MATLLEGPIAARLASTLFEALPLRQELAAALHHAADLARHLDDGPEQDRARAAVAEASDAMTALWVRWLSLWPWCPRLGAERLAMVVRRS